MIQYRYIFSFLIRVTLVDAIRLSLLFPVCVWSASLKLGLLHLYQADTVPVYQRIRLFVCANSVKTTDSDTYQEIPGTRFKHS
jgi:hypothetical protein